MFRGFFLVLAVLVLSQNSYGQDTIAPSFSFKWDNGFQLKSPNDNFSLNFGGRIFVDHAQLFPNSDLERNYGMLNHYSRTELTSARLFFSGEIYENVEFKLQVDFAGEKVAFKDVYIGITNIPAVGNLRIGQLHEPFRFSALTSGKYTTFMERGANTHFSHNRNTGAVIFNDFFNKRLSVQLGAFQNPSDSTVEGLHHDGYAVTGRITALPIRDIEKSRLLHLGVGYSFRNPESKEYEVSISPGSKLADKFIETDIIQNVNDVGLLNLEAVYIHGPFSLQSEYLDATVNIDNGNYHFSNYYAELSYFITGESKKYQGSYQGFGRVKPKKNFGGKEKGFGAWEVAAEFSQTDLNDGIVKGGQQFQLAMGVNWYLNPVTRFMFNYSHASIENKGNLDVVQARLQIDF
jgi:phosphate-selective porin OprO/OprP